MARGKENWYDSIRDFRNQTDGAVPMHGHYDSNLNERQWKLLEPFFKSTSKVGAKRQISRRVMINAILYVVRTGCPWRLLPKDFPKWKTVYNFFWEHSRAGTWERIHQQIRGDLRENLGRPRGATIAIVDSQSVKNAGISQENGYDAGKKVKGRKRHLLVDTLGLVIAVIVGSACKSDERGARKLLRKAWQRERTIKKVFADKAYWRNGLGQWLDVIFSWVLIVVQRSTATQGFEVLPKRWIVERTFAWISNDRRHSKDYEVTTTSSESMIQLSMIRLMTHRISRITS